MAKEEDATQAMDAVLKALGWRGRYQLTQISQLFLCILPAAFNILSIVFIGKANEYKCKEADNATSYMIPSDVINVTYGACSVTWMNVTGEQMEMTCPNDLEYAEPVDRSLMSEWGLVCEKEALTDVSQTLLLAGMMVGAVLFTSLADRYGRKPFHILCCLGMLAIGVASAFVPTYAAFLPLRFFLGAFQQGMSLTAGILSMESLPTRHRFVQSIIAAFIWSSSMVILALLAFLMRQHSWRHLQLIIAGFSVYSFVLIFFLEESVRWLVANGRVEHAERILKKAAAQNKVSQVDVLNVFRTKVLRQHTSDEGHDLKNGASEVPGEHPNSLLGSHSASGDKEDLPKYGITDFFRHKHVFICTVINGFAWAVNAVTYYGLSMTSVTLADNMYLGFFLSTVVELPSVVAFILIERFGRKRICDIFHIVAGLSLLASVTLSSLAGDNQASNIAGLILNLVGKFAISGSFAVLFLYTPEQFPTNLRNASLGVASMTGRVGAMIAPYSRTLSRHFPWAPGTIFGVLCLLMPVCMRLLPETCGRELPQTITDMELYISTPYHVPRHSRKNQKSEVI
ncbi:organic cation transporter protein-like [Babylonia areolata]|uniref:organic cation transporter protein-like n=1 Tax=Babylonia areolata TaxID=304850 RepID=UPI003FCEE8DA